MVKIYSEWRLNEVDFSERTYVSVVKLFGRLFYVVEEVDEKPF